MKPFFVDSITCQVIENPGIDGSFIFLNCKNLNIELSINDFVKISRNSEIMAIIDIIKIENDGIFSHWKLKCKIITNDRNVFINPLELKSGQWLYKPENHLE